MFRRAGSAITPQQQPERVPAGIPPTPAATTAALQYLGFVLAARGRPLRFSSVIHAWPGHGGDPGRAPGAPASYGFLQVAHVLAQFSQHFNYIHLVNSKSSGWTRPQLSNDRDTPRYGYVKSVPEDFRYFQGMLRKSTRIRKTLHP